MRTRRWTIAVLGALLLPCTGRSYTQQDSDALDALHDGQLTIWVIGAERPLTALEDIIEAHHATPLAFREQSAGNFGSTVGNFGTSASNYGIPSDSPTISTTQPGSITDPGANSKSPEYHEQTSGSFGQNSGGYGQASSDHGQTAGSLGETASSYGTASSNDGQTASSFGNSLSTIAQAAGSVTPLRHTGDAEEKPKRLSPQLQEDFPNLQVTYLNVAANELKDRLKEAEGTAEYPDMLIGTRTAAWWDGMRSEFGVPMLMAAVYTEGNSNLASGTQFEIMAHAPHMDGARALALWLNEASAGCAGCVLRNIPEPSRTAAATAVGAVQHLLQGNNFGDQDASIAKFPPQLGKELLRTTGEGGVVDSGIRVQVARAAVQGRLAAVSLRVLASADTVFGAVHPLVVLRRGDDGHWRILHVSLNLSPEEQSFDQALLMDNLPLTPSQLRDGALGVTLAAPQDGDTRRPMPELWWDNHGGARLQVVEWQRQAENGWSDARLNMVSDRNSRLQTRVTASFARSVGQYRWRVWSLGMGGEMKISPWRTVKIVP